MGALIEAGFTPAEVKGGMSMQRPTQPYATSMPLQGEEVRASTGEGRRIDDAITRGPAIEILVNGRPLRAFEGESVAAALLAAGKRVLRTTARRGEPRGLYCGIGICFDCVMTIDGEPNVRACQTAVRAGMHVESQSAHGTWRVEA